MLYEGLEDVTQPVIQEEARIKSAQPKPIQQGYMSSGDEAAFNFPQNRSTINQRKSAFMSSDDEAKQKKLLQN